MNTKCIAFVTFTVASLAWTFDASAATKFWKDSIPVGAFSTSTNWSAVSAAGTDNGGAPLASEPALIVHTSGVAHTVTVFGTPPSLGNLMIDLTGAGATTNTLTISNNVTLSAASFFVGGHNGVSFTNGRGTVNQSNGSVTTPAGHALVVGYGAGSTGTYTLSGTGQLSPGNSEHIGYFGNGTFNHSGGINTISGAGLLIIGSEAGGVGTYNLSGSGQLISNSSQYVADRGAGVFNQTGGTNTINGTNNLILGNNAGSVGTYTISGTATLFVGDDLVVGQSGTGVLNVQGQSSVIVNDQLSIGAGDAVNLSGGTLRFNTYSRHATGQFNFTGGTLRLTGNRTVGSDATIADLFGATPTIGTGKTVAAEGALTTLGNVNVSGGTLRALTGGITVGDNPTSTLTITNGGAVTTASGARVRGSLEITGGGTMICNGDDDVTSIGRIGGGVASFIVRGPGSSATFSGGNAGYLTVGNDGLGTMEITDGGSVTSGVGNIGNNYTASVTVSGAGSVWNTAGGLIFGETGGAGTLTVRDQGLVNVAGISMVGNDSTINLQGGTLRFGYYGRDQNTINFQAGTVQLTGDRTVGTDAAIADFFGINNYAIPAGKGLTIEGNTTFATSLTLDGGTFTTGQLVNPAMLLFQRGTLNLTNQEVTIGSGGPFGSTLDLAADKTLNVTQGITNQGLVTGDGQIGGPFINGVSGELRASAGQSLKLTGSAYSYGQIKLLGGELEFTDNISTAPGSLISGNGTIIARLGIFNQGVMNFAGTANIVGDVINNAGGRIISGGGGTTVFFDDVVNNAEIRTSTNGFSVFFGSVSGSGTFTGTGTVNFEGDLKPGSSPAAISFGGDVSFGVDASLEIEIGGLTAGSQHDKLNIAGDLALDGELEVSLINGFNPSAGQSFNILDWGSLAGTFSSISLPTLAGLAWNTSQLYTTGILSIAAAGLTGDFNNDGYVDSADYVVWRKNTSNAALPNDNGLTTQAARFNLWRANFGNISGSGSSAGSSNASVPEPSTSVVLVTALFIGLIHPARRRFGFTARPVYHFSK